MMFQSNGGSQTAQGDSGILFAILRFFHPPDLFTQSFAMDAEEFHGLAALSVDVLQCGFDELRFDRILQSFEQFTGRFFGVLPLSFSPCTQCRCKLMIDTL